MDDFQKQILTCLSDIKFLLAIAIIMMLISMCTSCSRSTVRFKGTGDIEYMYKGQNGPDFAKADLD
jgi:hypothetical protein